MSELQSKRNKASLVGSWFDRNEEIIYAYVAGKKVWNLKERKEGRSGLIDMVNE